MSEVLYGGAEGLELDVLAVFSHPDDAELTVGRHASQAEGTGATARACST